MSNTSVETRLYMESLKKKSGVAPKEQNSLVVVRGREWEVDKMVKELKWYKLPAIR